VHKARFLAGAADPAHIPKLSYPEIAFAGRSNVGKSSLLNRLVGQRKLARVSKTPGRTQQINFFLIDERLVFVDLPGYGFARVPAHVQQEWKHLVETYVSTRRKLRAVAVIVDLRRGVEADDAQLLAYLHAHGIRAILVATKADKLAYGARQRRGGQETEESTTRRCAGQLLRSQRRRDQRPGA
jgi:GTP-binding protein